MAANLGVYFDAATASVLGPLSTAGVTNPDGFVVSAWVKPESGSGINPQIIHQPSNAWFLRLTEFDGTNWRAQCEARTTGGTQILYITSNAVIPDGAWAHVVVAYDGMVNENAQLYVNGTNQDDTARVDRVITSGIVDFSDTTGIRISRGGTAASRLTGGLQEIWVATEFYDVAANIEKFISGGEAVTNLHLDGDLPTPVVYLKDDFTTFETNYGSLGNFSRTEPITNEGTQPQTGALSSTGQIKITATAPTVESAFGDDDTFVAGLALADLSGGSTVVVGDVALGGAFVDLNVPNNTVHDVRGSVINHQVMDTPTESLSFRLATSLGTSQDNKAYSVVGGLFLSHDPLTATWRDIHDPRGFGVHARGGQIILDGVRCFGHADPFGFGKGSSEPQNDVVTAEIRNSWFTRARDDAIENDDRQQLLIDDCLFDDCYTWNSAQNTNTYNANHRTITVTDTLVHLKRLPGARGHENHSVNEAFYNGHGNLFKWETESPKVILRDCIFYPEYYKSTTNDDLNDWISSSISGLGIVFGDTKFAVDIENLTIVWTRPEGLDYPGFIDPDFADQVTITTDTKVFTRARRQWIEAHPLVSRLSGELFTPQANLSVSTTAPTVAAGGAIISPASRNAQISSQAPTVFATGQEPAGRFPAQYEAAFSSQSPTAQVTAALEIGLPASQLFITTVVPAVVNTTPALVPVEISSAAAQARFNEFASDPIITQPSLSSDITVPVQRTLGVPLHFGFAPGPTIRVGRVGRDHAGSPGEGPPQYHKKRRVLLPDGKPLHLNDAELLQLWMTLQRLFDDLVDQENSDAEPNWRNMVRRMKEKKARLHFSQKIPDHEYMRYLLREAEDIIGKVK
jgi:hypothetical protein